MVLDLVAEVVMAEFVKGRVCHGPSFVIGRDIPESFQQKVEEPFTFHYLPGKRTARERESIEQQRRILKEDWSTLTKTETRQ